MFPSKVKEINEVAKDTVEIVLEKPTGYEYKAGQHAGLILDEKKESDRDNRHTFSFTSNPKAYEISFITRLRDSVYKKSLSKLSPGDDVHLSPPGGFEIGENLDSDSKFLYLSGGIGITPLLSYLRGGKNLPVSATLVWSNKSPTTTPLFKEITEGDLSKIEGFVVKLFMTDADESKLYSRGRIDSESLRKVVELEDFERVYLIGSEGFVEDIFSLLVNLGVGFDSIVTENFSGY